MSSLDPQTHKLAAIAYGEASEADVEDEIAGIAFAVANRCRAWGGKTVDELLNVDPNYTYATNGKNQRFNKYMKQSSQSQITKHRGMALAWECATRALANIGSDPSNGAFWWDGRDFRDNYERHPKVRDGFRFSSKSHNIFNVAEQAVEVAIYWKVKNKKTGEEVVSKLRGKYSCVWMSTAAYGETIFWKHDQDYLNASGCKDYR